MGLAFLSLTMGMSDAELRLPYYQHRRQLRQHHQHPTQAQFGPALVPQHEKKARDHALLRSVYCLFEDHFL